MVFTKIYLAHKIITLVIKTFLLSSGLKFNKIDIDIDLVKRMLAVIS